MVLIGIVLLLAIAGGVVFAIKMSSTGTVKNDEPAQASFTFSELQANYPAQPEACLATSRDTSLTLDATEQTDIENSVIGVIIDVPAGTNADIYVKTHDKTSATGTSVYESTYGTYNFTAKKANQGWVVTKFLACAK